MSISDMPWGITLWLDLWCVGIASGAFMNAFVIDKLSSGTQRNLFRFAVLSGLVFAFIGVILLLSHLGHILWFWHMFVTIRPQSVLSLGGWILSLWLAVAGIMAVLWVVEHYISNNILVKKINGVLSWVGFALSILLITYGGVLIATTNQPLWANTLLLPSLFIGSALCTSVAWLIILSYIVNWLGNKNIKPLDWLITRFTDSSDYTINNNVVARLIKALFVYLVIEIVILAAFMVWLWFTAESAFTQLVFGEMAVYFWAGLVALGLVLPLALLGINRCRNKLMQIPPALAISSAGLAFIGGLVLRAVLLVSAQL